MANNQATRNDRTMQSRPENKEGRRESAGTFKKGSERAREAGRKGGQASGNKH